MTTLLSSIFEGEMSAISPSFRPYTTTFSRYSLCSAYGILILNPSRCSTIGAGLRHMSIGSYPSRICLTSAGCTKSGSSSRLLFLSFRILSIASTISSSLALSSGVLILDALRPTPETMASQVSSTPSGAGPETSSVGTWMSLISSALVSTQVLKFPIMKMAPSYSSMTHLSVMEICEVFLPRPLAMPMTTVTAPFLLRISAMSQIGWGMWCLPRVGPTTAISVPASGTFLTSPPMSLQTASTASRSSSGTDITTLSIWELRFF